MNAATLPIEADAAIFQTLHCLTEKFVVDFANGIDVTHDHLRVQHARSGIFLRMYDSFTGQGVRRQAEINANLADGVEATLHWLGELTESLAHSTSAIAQVNDRVTALTKNVTQLVHYSADTRKQLEALTHQLNRRMHGMAQEIARIDFIQKAQLNMDATFDKWAAGRFASLSPAARCYAALEELRWGALGDYCRKHNGQRQCHEFKQMVADRATKQLAEDAAVSLHEPAAMNQVWLATPTTKQGRGDDDLWQAVAYLADDLPVDNAPFVNSAVQQRPASRVVPLIADARRVAAALTQEVLHPEAIDV